MMNLKVEKKLGKVEVEKILKSEVSKSEKMKKLFLGGLEVKEIAELMQVRYNFVYNVVSNMIRVDDLEAAVVKTEKEGKREDIVRLMNEGKSNIEISKILKSNYNYVWKVVNEELKKGKKEVK